MNSSKNSFDDLSLSISVSYLCLPITYITSSNGVHSQQIIPMAELKLDHLFCSAKVTQLLLLGLAALFYQVFEQQCIFTHPLNGLQQVGCQVHLIPELHLLILEEEIIITVLNTAWIEKKELPSLHSWVCDILTKAEIISCFNT